MKVTFLNSNVPDAVQKSAATAPSSRNANRAEARADIMIDVAS